MMKFFALSLKRDARRWFESLGKGKISSFAGFVEAFCRRWALMIMSNGCPLLKDSSKYMVHKPY
jgi:hypothetical protein